MNTGQDRMLHDWLAARDPGDSPARLRAVAAQLPETGLRAAFPTADAVMWRMRGMSTSARLVVVLVVLLAVVVGVGAVLLRPWQPFPPGGLIAYVGPLGSTGATGINLVLPDGTGRRAVSPGTSNVFDHSPRWSVDGRTLAFARNSDLDAFGACGGIGSIVVHDVATAKERVIATGLRPMDVIEWAPSGDRIAFLWPPPGCNAPGELGFVDLASGTVTTSQIGDGTWRLQRAGATITAVDTTVWAVDSISGELVARCLARDGTFAGHVEVLDREIGAHIDLGIGWAPAWSPDESAMAFIQVTDVQAGGTEHGARVAVAGVQGWQIRTLSDITDPDFLRFGDVARLPQVHWTSDGTAIYWLDASGAHIVDVAGGRSFDLAALPSEAADVQWQPTPESN
jgi:WD40-like Beta Propeller Repeat.